VKDQSDLKYNVGVARYTNWKVTLLVPFCLCVTHFPVFFTSFPGEHAPSKSSRLQHILTSDRRLNGNSYFYLFNEMEYCHNLGVCAYRRAMDLLARLYTPL
jgi:hypothetical protein